jgi:hypothetical protein
MTAAGAPMPEDAMDTDRPCGRCGLTLRPGETIIVVGTGELCLACFNAEMAQQLNVDFDDTVGAVVWPSTACPIPSRSVHGWHPPAM